LDNYPRYLELEVENNLYFNRGDYVKIASEAHDDILRETDGVSLYSGINTNLLECIGRYYKDKMVEVPEKDSDGNIVYDTTTGEVKMIEAIVRVGVVLLDLSKLPEDGQSDATGTGINDIKDLALDGMGLVNLG
jgi:hypothetical protein